MSLEFWKGSFEIASVVLLFLTFVCGAGALYFSDRVNKNQADRLRQFDSTLTDAKTELGKQQERAANADARVAGLETDAANAKAKQQSVEVDLGKQQERAANAERSLLELQRRIEPRRITAAQRVQLIHALSSSAKGPAQILCVLGDGEGCALAEQVKDVLTASGWTCDGVNQGIYSGGNPIGIFLAVHSTAAVPPHAVPLQQAFFSIGLPLNGGQVPDVPAGSIRIVVGNKPN